MTLVARREFLAGLGVLCLGFDLGCGTSAQTLMIRHADKTGELTANAFVTVKRDGRIEVAINKTEFGQGVTTAYCTLVAEELDVPVEDVDFHFADSLPEYRTSYTIHQTGGSSSTKEGYPLFRHAAACAREMLVGAAAEWWKVPASECTTRDGFVHHAASGRKFQYGEITLLAARWPVPDSPKLKSPKQFQRIGKDKRPRVDARAKVDGTARFGIDVEVPGMVRAHIVHGAVFGAKPVSFDAASARKRRGVIDVFAIDAGVVVVAEKYWQALAAANELKIEWSAGAAADLDTEKLRASLRSYADDGEVVREDGNAKKAIAKSRVTVSAEYEFPYLAHATMEPQNCVAHVTDDKVEIWAPCQSPSVVQAFVADALDVKQSDVLVHTVYAGGGFGRRILGDYAAQAALVSRQVKRPVQLMWSRESDMTQGFYRPIGAAKMKGAVSEDGKSVALSAHILSQSIALDSAQLVDAIMPGVPTGVRSTLVNAFFGMVGSNTLPDFFSSEGVRDTPYRFSDFTATFTPIRTKLPVASWRSVGHSYNGFVMESMLDELARAAKEDPLAFRQRLLPKNHRAQRVLDAVVTLSGWGKPLPPGIGRGLARHESFETEVAEVAEVEIVRDRVRVRRIYAVVDCGLAINPDIVRSQVEGAIIFGLSAALEQEITVANGAVQQTNFDGYPPLRMHESPEIIVEILPSEKDPTGIGEPGLPPSAPAVANAIFALTGVRLRRLPLQRAWREAKR
jgi:isoquinoline 1-oxidoreductase/isoquinoline 1-oxidoreductase beta subunit